MFYLTRLGSFQPPAAARPQYGPRRAIPQSAVDWLFDAITRAISPAQLEFARKELIEGEGGTLHVEVPVIRLDAETLSKEVRVPWVNALLRDVRDRWVEGQADYHNRTARTMHRMYTFLRKLGSGLSMT